MTNISYFNIELVTNSKRSITYTASIKIQEENYNKLIAILILSFIL